MKIVLTGHKGFIGSHYYNYVSKDNEVTTFDRLDGGDLCNPKVIENSPNCDAVVHMAAVNGTKLFYEIPNEVALNNTIPTINLVEKYKNTDTKFVFISTCEIFNGAVDRGLYSIPTDEGVPIMFDDIINPRWSYSLPKALGENYVANSGLPWLIIRYFNVYGPGQKDHFISEFVERALKGEFYLLGNDTRSFCYIDDAIKMTHELVKNSSGKIVNVGRNQEYQIDEVARIILDLMDIDPSKLTIRPGKAGSAKRRCPDTKLVEKLTGFKDYTPIREGLKKTLESLI